MNEMIRRHVLNVCSKVYFTTEQSSKAAVLRLKIFLCHIAPQSCYSGPEVLNQKLPSELSPLFVTATVVWAKLSS